MPNFPTPTVTITTAEPPRPDFDRGASVTVMDQHRRVIAPGRAVTLGETTFSAGEVVTLTAAEAERLEGEGALLPVGQYPKAATHYVVGKVQEIGIAGRWQEGQG